MRLISVLLGLTWCTAAPAVCSVITVPALLCEHATNPLGVASPQPNPTAFEDGCWPIQEAAPELKILVSLPQNTRYFQYGGLPFVATYYMGAWRPDGPVKSHQSWTGGSIVTHENEPTLSAKYGNFGTYCFWNWNQNFLTLHSILSDENFWQQVRKVLKEAYDNDYIVMMDMWHSAADYVNRRADWGHSDMMLSMDDPLLTEDLGRYNLPGKTRMDLHKLAIKQAVKYTWDLPNVVYSFGFEYAINILMGNADQDGSFVKWWADEMRAQGKQIDPNITHRFGIMYGAERGTTEIKPRYPHRVKDEKWIRRLLPKSRPTPPSVRGCDFIIGECYAWGFDQHPEAISQEARNWAVPLVRSAVAGLEYLPHKAIKENEELILEQIVNGVQTGESYYGATDNAKKWLLQLRWYMENITSWEDEPGCRGGNEITMEKLPRFAASTQPTLATADGYRNGAIVDGSSVDFSVIYKDADNDAPAQAEVWVDMNGDGRFDPDPTNGERITMTGRGDNYKDGVVYTVKGITPNHGVNNLRYVFRFGDRNWYPPVVGGVVSGNYGHFRVTVP